MKNKMLVVGLLWALVATGCQNSDDKQSFQAQSLILQADGLIRGHHLSEAEDQAGKAIEILNAVVSDEPNNIGFRLMRARACLTLFLAKNLTIIENAPEPPHSLVREVPTNTFIDYSQLIPLAEGDISYALKAKGPLTAAQGGLAHTLLARIYRLDIDRAPAADAEYQKAIESYQREVDTLKKEQPPAPATIVALMRLNNEISSLQLNQVEIRLLFEDWHGALNLLETMMNGDSLKDLSLQLTVLKNRLTELQGTSKTGQQGLEAAAVNTIVDKNEVLEGPASAGIAIHQTEREMSVIKNNLVYRIICYYNLNEGDLYREARGALHPFYPELDDEIGKKLESSSSAK